MILIFDEAPHYGPSSRLHRDAGQGLDGTIGLGGRAVHVELSRRARRDVRGLDRPVRRGIVEALHHIDAPNADVKSLAGRPPWRRLRVGGHRIVFRMLGVEELAALDVTDVQGVLVARIVHRRELERAIGSLV